MLEGLCVEGGWLNCFGVESIGYAGEEREEAGSLAALGMESKKGKGRFLRSATEWMTSVCTGRYSGGQENVHASCCGCVVGWGGGKWFDEVADAAGGGVAGYGDASRAAGAAYA